MGTFFRQTIFYIYEETIFRPGLFLDHLTEPKVSKFLLYNRRLSGWNISVSVYSLKVNNEGTPTTSVDVVLVSLLITLNKLHAFLYFCYYWCFCYYWYLFKWKGSDWTISCSKSPMKQKYTEIVVYQLTSFWYFHRLPWT